MCSKKRINATHAVITAEHSTTIARQVGCLTRPGSQGQAEVRKSPRTEGDHNHHAYISDLSKCCCEAKPAMGYESLDVSQDAP